MLARKIYNVIEQHFVNKEQEIILVDGSRQVGKTYIWPYTFKYGE